MNTQPQPSAVTLFEKVSLIVSLTPHFRLLCISFPFRKKHLGLLRIFSIQAFSPGLSVAVLRPSQFYMTHGSFVKNSDKIYFEKSFWKKIFSVIFGKQKCCSKLFTARNLDKKEKFYQKKRSSITNQDIYFKDNLYLQDI